MVGDSVKNEAKVKEKADHKITKTGISFFVENYIRLLIIK